MAFCTNCGQQLTGSAFCTSCGAPSHAAAGNGVPVTSAQPLVMPAAAPRPAGRTPAIIAIAVAVIVALGLSAWFFVIRPDDTEGTALPSTVAQDRAGGADQDDADPDDADANDEGAADSDQDKREENESSAAGPAAASSTGSAPAGSATASTSTTTVTATAAGTSSSSRSATSSAAEPTSAATVPTGPTTPSIPPGIGTYAPQTTVIRDGAPLAVTPVTTSVAAGTNVFPIQNGEAIFTTATGNVICRMGTDRVQCDINPDGISYTPGAAPAGCSGTWGYSVGFTSTNPSGTWVCSQTPWAISAAPILAYGTELTNGSFRCASQELGITCLGATNHGFRISRSDGAIFY